MSNSVTDARPVDGCDGCKTALGASGCPVHGRPPYGVPVGRAPTAENDAGLAALYRFLTERGFFGTPQTQTDTAAFTLASDAFKAGWRAANAYQERQGGPG